MSEKQDQVLGHAEEADGIEEYDNRLPVWWLGIFYCTIIWGISYAIHYHLVGSRSQTGEYDAEVMEAAVMWPAPSAEAVAKAGAGPEAIAAGQEIYNTNCVACHGADMTGGIGPNLVDSEWIHGGDLETITRIITEGVPAKGMLTWGPILGPEKVAQVAAFIHSKSH